MITALPTPPSRVDSSTFSARADNFLGALPAFATEANALATDVNAKQVSAAASELAAAASAATAVSATAYKGPWSSLSGALAIPASVSHLGATWGLVSNVADVTAHTPGVSSQWDKLTAVEPGLVLIATLTPTVAATVDALTVFGSAYDNYLIVGSSITPSANDQLRFQLAVAGVADTAANYYTAPSMSITATTTAVANGTITGNTGASGKGGFFTLTVSNVNGTGAKAGLVHSMHETGTANNFSQALYGVLYTPSPVVTGLRLLWNSGSNFAATGTIRIYGYSKT